MAEPHIFNELRQKYGKQLQESWDTMTIPKQSENTVLLVERRKHPNIEFVLHNFMYFCRPEKSNGRAFSLTIACSDENEGYVREILGKHADSTNILVVFKGEGDREQGIADYNALMTSADFYRKIEAEYILSIQTDTYLRHPLPECLWQIDYAACTWAWKQDLVGGGGLTWRKKEAVLDMCENSKCDDKGKTAEDAFFAESCLAMNKKILPVEIGSYIFSESVFNGDPVGVHQWWTFLIPGIQNKYPGAEGYFEIYMTIYL